MRWRLFSLATAALGYLMSSSPAAAADLQWTNLGGNVNSYYDPAVTYRYDGSYWQVDAYVVNNDTSMSVAQINDTMRTFSGWTNLGGRLVTAGSAIAWGMHREVFGLGTDYALYHQWSDDNSTWSGWWPLYTPPSGALCTKPSAVSWSPGRIDVFVRGCDSVLWHTWANSGGQVTWEGWENLGGNMNSSPTAVSRAPYVLDVLITDFNGEVWDKYYNGSGWTWRDTHMKGTYDPSAIVDWQGQVVAYTHNKAASNILSSAFNYTNLTWSTPAPSATIANGFRSPHPLAFSEYASAIYRDLSGYIYSQGSDDGLDWFMEYPNEATQPFAGEPADVYNGSASYSFAVQGDSTLWYFTRHATP